MRSKAFPILTLAAAFLLAEPRPGQASSFMSPEEATAKVQEAYAKLTFAVDLGTIHDNVLPGNAIASGPFNKALEDNKLQFELSDFRTIRIKDAAAIRYSDILTRPNGADDLLVSESTWKWVTEPTATSPAIEVVDNYATARWTPGEAVNENWDIPVVEAMAQAEHPEWWSTIVSYSVLARFQGKTRSYRAFLVFGIDSEGSSHILLVDTVLQGGALHHFLTASPYPATLLRTPYRSDSAVMSWLRSASSTAPTCASGQVCCDLSTSRCGVLTRDIEQELRKEPIGTLAGGEPAAHGKPSGRRSTDFNCNGPVGGGDTPSGGPDCGDPPPRCADFSFPVDQGTAFYYNTLEHSTYDHHVGFTGIGSCTYVQRGQRLPNGNYPCYATASSSIIPIPHEQGRVTIGKCHYASVGESIAGVASGPDPTAYSAAAFAVNSCWGCLCGAISITYHGLSVTYTPDTALWKQEYQASVYCPYMESSQPSPIVINLDGEGFQNVFTSAANGVQFDFYGTGRPIQISWTAADANVGFLVLDRNGNGKIDNAREMFGNITDQPRSNDPNGYLALAVFDLPSNGGNGNGIIDPADEVWSKLRVWVDSTHTGDSSQGKLYTLNELGIRSIGLKYVKEEVVDQYGNELRYKGTIQRDLDYGNIVFTHDVFFRMLSTKPQS